MRDKNQVFIFNDEELSLIKNTFADNDALLYAVRKVFLQFPLTGPERGLLKLAITPAVFAVLKKRILPELSDEFPLSQLPTILSTLTEQLKVRSVEEMAPLFAAKALEIAYLEQQFAVLENIDTDVEQKIQLSVLSKIDDTPIVAFVNTQAYLFLLGYIDPMLGFIKSIAGSKSETVEQAKKRMDRNSSK